MEAALLGLSSMGFEGPNTGLPRFVSDPRFVAFCISLVEVVGEREGLILQLGVWLPREASGSSFRISILHSSFAARWLAW